MKKAQQVVVVGAAAVAATILVAVVLRKPAPDPLAAIPTSESSRPAAQEAAPGEQVVINIPVPRPSEEEMKEIRYLPERVELPEGAGSAVLRMPEMKAGTRRVRNLRPLTNKQRDGDMLAPKWSPDGLQILISKPGYAGIYLMNVNGGAPVFVAPGNAYNAKWTADGNIEVIGEDGQIRTYAPDGTLLGTRPAGHNDGPVYSDNDTVFVRTPEGTAMPLTTGDDRYFNPVLSPDGSQVVYQGLTSGLYLAPADGSAPPVYIGQGNNPVWVPDGSGVLFDVTSDDGHYLTDGDIYFVDSSATERTNITEGDGLIGQLPAVNPGGDQVAFEAEGVIYVGEVQ